ncbi:LysR family transcriptional regulator [Thalassospira lucentensis]|uniref:LysR family transcriptional regulator n=1 Tax=Thalassospira lucentensis TaxID=168935 RepID=UPI003AA9267E
MLNFKQLEAIYWLRELQNFGKVANRLHVTQPAVSSRIASLENQIGQKLIERTHASIRLTLLGEQIADHAEKIVNAQYALLDNIRRNEKSVLRMGMIGPVALTWGRDLHDRIKDIEPDLEIEFSVGTSADLERELKAGSIDLAFVSMHTQQKHISSGLALAYDLGWVGASSLATGLKQPLSLETLSRQELIMYPQTSPLYSPVHDILMRPDAAHGIRHHASSLTTIIEMLRLGYGFSMLALAVVEKDIDAGSLMHVKSEVTFPPLIVHCLFQTGHSRRPLRMAFETAREVARDYVSNQTRFIRIVKDNSIHLSDV